MTTDIRQELAGLDAEQRRLLLSRLRQRRAVEPDARTAAPRASGRLSDAQQRLWLMDQLHGEGGGQRLEFALRLRGPLDVAALGRALDAVVARHEALRVRFVTVDDQPRQVVGGDAHLPLPVLDLRVEPVRATEPLRVDPAAGRPIAARLEVLGDQEHLLRVAAHHAVFDGASTGVFAADLAAFYAAACTGTPADLPPLRVGFVEWVDGERDRLTDELVARQLGYWRRTLSGAPVLSTVPPDRSRPAVSAHRGATSPVDLPAGLCQDLLALARGERATLNVVLLAGLAAVLYRLAGQDDVLLGVSVAARTQREVEAVIGCFANTFVLRVDFSDDPTAAELVRRVRGALGAALGNQDVAYARVVQELAPLRSRSHNPLFQVMLSVADIAEVPIAAGEVTITVEHPDSDVTDFDLYLALSPHAGGLAGQLVYDADLYLPGTIRGAVRDLGAVLREFAAHPRRTVREAASLRGRDLAVAATYTADPVVEVLGFWQRLLRRPGRVQLAPYGQVFQQLLGGLAGDDVVVLLRWEDFLRHLPDASQAGTATVLARAVDDLVQAITAFREYRDAPLIIGVTPASQRYAGSEWAALFAHLEDALIVRCTGIPDVSVLPADVWQRRYRSAEVSDARADELGHVPYVPEFFTVLGTELARRLHARGTSAPRVLIVARDRVLGQVAEQAPARAALDGALAAQVRWGRRVAVCPAGEDILDLVRAVVEAGDVEAADCLVLDVDRAALRRVSEAYPRAGTVLLPAPGALPRFLEHLWALDGPVRGTGRADLERLADIAGQLGTAGAIAIRVREERAPSAPAGGPLVPARTPVQRQLVALWREVLHRDDLGITTDFFSAGGHSLLAAQLLSRVHAVFGKAVELTPFLTQPTVIRLAELVEQSADSAPITATPRGPDSTPSSTQQRLWALAQIDADTARHGYTLAVTLRGPLDVHALREAVAEIVCRHEVLRTTFDDREGRPVAVRHDHLDCWLPDIDLTGAPAARRANALADHLQPHARLGYDLAAGPLVRAQLIRAGDDIHHLIVGMHHIVCDNWSWNLFQGELAALYNAMRAGEPSPLAALPVQFADVVDWQRRRDPRDGGHEDYWRQRLRDAPPVLDLPTDGPRSAHGHRAARYRHGFDPALGAALRQVSAATGTSLFSALLAGYATVMGGRAGTDDLVLGVPVLGRDRPETEQLIGYFADLVPVRLDLGGDPDLPAALRRTHARVMEALAHARVPFSRIVDLAATTRSPLHHPVFQHVFNFIDQPDEPLSLHGLTVEAVQAPPGGTDFETFLTLSWAEDRLVATVDYREDLFDPATVRWLVGELESVLTDAVADPTRPVRAGLSPAGVARAGVDEPGAVPERPAEATVVGVVGSFDTGPLRAPVERWLSVSGLPVALDFAADTRIFHRLVDGTGPGSGTAGLQLVLLRWSDWLAYREGTGLAAAATALDRVVDDAGTALRLWRARTDAPLVIVECPSAPGWSDASWRLLFGGLSERLGRCAADLPEVAITPIERWLPGRVAGAGEPAALGQAIVRLTHAILGRRTDTLIVRAERSLFRTTAHGRHTSARQAEILRFLRGTLRAGRRLVMWEPGDVSGLRDHLDSGALPIRPQEVVACRGGRPLPDELAALAGEGTIELSRCVLLDPDPAVAAIARDRFTDLAVVALPEEAEAVRRVLHDVWYLDPPALTPAPVSPSPAPVAALLGAAEEPATGTGTGTTAAGPQPAVPPAERAAQPGPSPYRAPATEREHTLAGIWADLLHIPRVGVDDDFFDLGGDSMLGIQAAALAGRAGIQITPRQLVDHPTVAALAALGDENRGARGPDDSRTPLLPAQHWFFTTVAPGIADPNHFNHPYYLELAEHVAPAYLHQALRQLAAHHDSLRLRFDRGPDGGWSQRYDSSPEVPFASHDLSALDAAQRAERMVELCARTQAGLDITAGPLVRAVHFRLGPDAPDRLLVVAHHLVVDGMSRGLFLEDLQTLCRQLPSGAAVRLPAKTTSVQEWSRRLYDYARSDELRAELPFWLAQSAAGDPPIPVDFPDGDPAAASFDTLRATLEHEHTAALRATCRRLGMNMGELTAAVVAGWIADVTGAPDATLALAGHGRENLFDDLDVSRTTGWFQIYYPVRIRDPRAGLAAVKSQLAQVRRNGIGYGLLRYCCDDDDVRAALAAVPPPMVSVNYMGDFSFAATPAGVDLFGVPGDDFGPPQDRRMRWRYLVDVVPVVIDGRLTLEFNYSANFHRSETAHGILAELVARLRALAQDSSPDSPGRRG